MKIRPKQDYRIENSEILRHAHQAKLRAFRLVTASSGVNAKKLETIIKFTIYTLSYFTDLIASNIEHTITQYATRAATVVN